MPRPDDGGPVFSSPPVYVDENMGPREMWEGQPGMTLREHYAGLALQSVLASKEGINHPAFAAKLAVEFADALILALKPREEN